MKKSYKIIFWTIIILSSFGLIAVYMWRLWDLQFATTPGAFGTFGDYVGGVFGSITGLVSVVFLYFTYMKQLEIYCEQKSQAELNHFEQTFFHLLDNFGIIRQNLKNKEERTEGLAYIKSVRKLVGDDIDKVCQKEYAFDDLNVLTTRKEIEEIYKTAFLSESDQLGHYFRSLYHLLKYINEHCPKDKKMYFDLVQAQMNTDELYLTCINGISSYGRKKFYPLLNESSFLENLAIDENESIRKLVYFYYPKTKRKDPNGVRKNVILVTGTEGTRRGHLARMLIAEQIPARVTSIQGMLLRANKIPTDLKNNEQVLEASMEKTLDPDDVYVISCQFCQLNSDGTFYNLSSAVYEGLHPVAVVLMQSSLDYMLHSIRQDDKIILDETLAEKYRQAEESAAEKYANQKHVPLYKYDISDMNRAVENIRNLVAAFG